MKILIILKCSTYWVYHNTTIEVCTLKLHECLEIIIGIYTGKILTLNSCLFNFRSKYKLIYMDKKKSRDWCSAPQFCAWIHTVRRSTILNEHMWRICVRFVQFLEFIDVAGDILLLNLPSCLSMDESGHVEWLASWEENTPVHWIVNSFNMIRLFRYGDFAFTWTNQLQPYYSCLFCTTNTHYTLYQNVCRKCLLVFYKKEDLILLELWKWHLDSVDDQFVVRIRLCFLLELKIKAEVNGTKHK